MALSGVSAKEIRDDRLALERSIQASGVPDLLCRRRICQLCRRIRRRRGARLSPPDPGMDRLGSAEIAHGVVHQVFSRSNATWCVKISALFPANGSRIFSDI